VNWLNIRIFGLFLVEKNLSEMVERKNICVQPSKTAHFHAKREAGRKYFCV